MSQPLTPSSPDSPPVELSRVKDIHVMAVAGTGMGAFACLLQAAGYQVRGSDESVWPPMSDVLTEAGIGWFEGFGPENLEPPPDLVVVGNVIRRVNPEATAMRERGLPHLSFPEALGHLFLEDRHPIVVAGTHGKTTTTAMTAWVLLHAGADPSFLVGGVATNLGAAARLGQGPAFVVEGDEYDTAYFDKGPKFLHYRPRTAIVTSMEFDHADIYRDMDHYRSAFQDFVALVPEDGVFLACAGSEEVLALRDACAGTVETYAALPEVEANWTAAELTQGAHGARFVLTRDGEALTEVHLPLGGRHNVENALAAAAAAVHQGVAPEAIAAALAAFTGVKRRQEIRGVEGGVTVIDDFAHHPTAVEETVAAIRARFPDQRLVAVFEPRSNTARRNIYQAAYTRAFDVADQVVIASPPWHQDTIAEDERFDAAAVVEEIAARGTPAVHQPDAEAVLAWLAAEARDGDVVLIMSNGAFGGIHGRLLDALRGRA